MNAPVGYRYYRRQFLNRPGIHEGAYVLASVAADSRHHVLCISDCDRVIRLEFDRSSARRRRNALHKLDLLIDTLTGFRAALIEADAARRRC